MGRGGALIIRRYRRNPFMISVLSYFKMKFVDFWDRDYPEMLEVAGFRDKTIGMMQRFGARYDARQYIQSKRAERK